MSPVFFTTIPYSAPSGPSTLTVVPTPKYRAFSQTKSRFAPSAEMELVMRVGADQSSWPLRSLKTVILFEAFHRSSGVIAALPSGSILARVISPTVSYLWYSPLRARIRCFAIEWARASTTGTPAACSPADS